MDYVVCFFGEFSATTLLFPIALFRYDVYTPTQNIIYHDFAGNPDGHGPMEWLRPRFERLRQAALKRVRSTLELPDGQEGLNLANLGLYGLGRRRTLDQMSSFLHVDMKSQSSRAEMVRMGSKAFRKYEIVVLENSLYLTHLFVTDSLRQRCMGSLRRQYFANGKSLR